MIPNPDTPPPGGPGPNAPTVQEILDAYLQLGTTGLSPATLENARCILGLFAQAFGPRRLADCRAIDLLRWLKEQTQWRSAWTMQRALQTIKRPFNWALDVDLITGRNPFARARDVVGSSVRRHRRPMSDEHFQCLLRASDPALRRVLIFLKFSGCRPRELCTMRWSNVRFADGAAVLEEHKTAKSTGRPRCIPLVPTTVKLLLWMRRHRQASVIGLVERLLRKGPLKASELARQVAVYGVSHRGVARARAALGVRKERVAGGKEGYWVYRLPEDHQPLAEPAERDYVFVNSLGNPWNRNSLALKFRRIRRQFGLPKHVTLYTLRHRYGLMGIKHRVNLKLVSLAMGHADVRMTEKYIHEAGLTEDVRQAALQIAYGPGAVGLPPPAPPRPIPVVTPPPVEQIAPVAEHLPGRVGLERPRPEVSIRSEPAPAPAAASADRIEYTLNMILHRLSTPPSRASQPALIPNRLRPAEQASYDAFGWALAQEPSLAQAKDADVFAWLRARADCPLALPPLLPTFLRYVRKGRLYHDTRKRVLRPRVPAPEPPAEEGGGA